MVKSYLKFEHSKTFGQICSTSSNLVWQPGRDGPSGIGQAVVGANEDVLVWDIKKGELASRWVASDNRSRVTFICWSKTDSDVYAVGYEDGRIRVWDARTASVIMTFNGHKSAITQLCFDNSGVRLASGSRDTDIIVWDLAGEVGLFRLRGHREQITSLHFLATPKKPEFDSNPTESEFEAFLISTGKDALIKVWDLNSQHCIETRVAQTNGECWSLGTSPDGSGCITAGNDGELKAWVIDLSVAGQVARGVTDNKHILTERGTFYRQGKDRTLAVKFHPQKDLFAVHGAEKVVELWRIRSETEVRKSTARKRKRQREKAGTEVNGDVEQDLDDISSIPINEVFVPYLLVRTGGKVKSMDWAGAKPGKFESILVSTTNNQIEVFQVTVDEKKSRSKDQPDYARTLAVDGPGHRSDIRSLAISSDDRMLASASQGILKIWNVKTQTCLRTLVCGHALCATFLPGDKIVVVGTREGTLEIFDISSSTLIDTVEAHEKDIWALQCSPDGKSMVTGSADKTSKFWEFKVIQEEVVGTSRKIPKLTLLHTKTLKVNDDILALKFSPDGKYLAASTLDNTVKVFFVDTLKLFLTLYGHKLPVLSMDISYDSKLIVTSSADKNVRIWGLDFGDCHKAFFAHQDSILCVAFVPNNNEGNGHHFFSASKDKLIKYFDGDKFEQIQSLDGHQGEIWAMAVAHSGEFLVTASHDKSIRIWEQTDEQVFLEEEREKELEEMYENTLVASLEQEAREAESGLDVNGSNLINGNGVLASAGKQTGETLMAGEKIAESLELGLEDLAVMDEYKSQKLTNPSTALPQRHPVFLAANNIPASQYVLNTFQRIPHASLQDALLVLSFSQLPALFTFLSIWASEGRNIPLTCRILFFMLKTHQKQLVNSREMKGMLDKVKLQLRKTLTKQQKDMGFNIAGLRILGRRVGDMNDSEYFVDGDMGGDLSSGHTTNQEGSRKRAFVNVA